MPHPGADPELLLGGDANPSGGHLPNILVIFSENPMKLKKFWSVGEGGARAGGAPPKSATDIDKNSVENMKEIIFFLVTHICIMPEV